MRPEIAEKIDFISKFRTDIEAHFNGEGSDELRRRINRGMSRARDIVSESGARRLVTLSPPPAIGGLIVNNADPFSFILQDYYGMSLIPAVADMIDQAIGVLESPEYESLLAERELKAKSDAERQSNRKKDISPVKAAEPELPTKVTISWLIRHVPISFWFWFAGILAATFAAGLKLSPIFQR